MSENKQETTRRKFLKNGLLGAITTALAAMVGFFAFKKNNSDTVWQIDPAKCVACGNCATYCVLEKSAVKCVHAYEVCGYCDLCTGFFRPQSKELNTGAENQLCPTGAIKRTFIEDPYYEYTIDENLCNGCSKCVKGCNIFGNGSLFLQVRHNLCLNCNECSIAAACPSQAFKRVPINEPYLLKKNQHA